VRYRATLAYDGAPYLGYQRQATGKPTIQETVEVALKRLSGTDTIVYGAGRTDSGVHATGQVIAFDLDWRHDETALYKALNANLPDAVAILDVRETTPDFNPRFNALWRAYQYTVVWCEHPLPLERHTAWVAPHRFSLEPMQAGAALLRGKRDWGALGTPPQPGGHTVREIYGVTLAEAPLAIPADHLRLKIDVRANAFLYRMVRRIVGALYDIGRGKMSVDAFAAALDETTVMRRVAIAPPQGLVLTRVAYPGDDDTDTDISQTEQAAGSPAIE
jgi:tRNA pseudouridine38-40 synthase